MTYKTTATTHRTRPRNSFIACAALIITLALVLLLNFRLFVTSGPSMEPTYTEGTWLLSSRLYGTPQVGEVVFLKYQNIYCLKRVAFVAGEDVSAAGYEGYWGSNIIPEGYVYVLGDNADHSLDSRDPGFGLVAVSDIWGKPLIQRDKYSQAAISFEITKYIAIYCFADN